MSGPLVRRLALAREDATDVAALVLWRGPDELVASELELHPDELHRLRAMRHPGRRRDFAVGRHVARRAVAELIGTHDPRSSPIPAGVFGQPVLAGPAAPHLDVSIGHSGGLVGAVAFPRTHPLGLDIERTDEERCATIAMHASARERELIGALGLDELEALTCLWTAKEALSKALRTGLTLELERYAIASAHRDGERVRFEFALFRQYAAETLAGRTHCLGVCLPRRTRTVLDPDLLRSAESGGRWCAGSRLSLPRRGGSD